MGYAQVNGLTIAFDDLGGGDDVVVLVHGHPFDRSMWNPQIGAIVDAGWRVVVPDLRGYGESAPAIATSSGVIARGVTTLTDFARDIAGLLDAQGVRRAVLGGLSMGGQIVMEFCRLYPGRVRGIVLSATCPQAETEQGKQDRRAMADRLSREGMNGYATDVLSKMLSPHTIATQPAIAQWVLAMMRRAHPAGAAAALRGRAERPAYEETLATIGVPAIIVMGDLDPFTTRQDADRMHALLGTSELVWMKGVGHMPNLERPKEYNAALVRFLSRTRTPYSPGIRFLASRPR